MSATYTSKQFLNLICFESARRPNREIFFLKAIARLFISIL